MLNDNKELEDELCIYGATVEHICSFQFRNIQTFLSIQTSSLDQGVSG